jgi:hypothetical protein
VVIVGRPLHEVEPRSVEYRSLVENLECWLEAFRGELGSGCQFDEDPYQTLSAEGDPDAQARLERAPRRGRRQIVEQAPERHVERHAEDDVLLQRRMRCRIHRGL